MGRRAAIVAMVGRRAWVELGGVELFVYRRKTKQRKYKNKTKTSKRNTK
jgi:hypothetical protein